jgi:hypothetical protein
MESTATVSVLSIMSSSIVSRIVGMMPNGETRLRLNQFRDCALKKGKPRVVTHIAGLLGQETCGGQFPVHTRRRSNSAIGSQVPSVFVNSSGSLAMYTAIRRAPRRTSSGEPPIAGQAHPRMITGWYRKATPPSPRWIVSSSFRVPRLRPTRAAGARGHGPIDYREAVVFRRRHRLIAAAAPAWRITPPLPQRQSEHRTAGRS